VTHLYRPLGACRWGTRALVCMPVRHNCWPVQVLAYQLPLGTGYYFVIPGTGTGAHLRAGRQHIHVRRNDLRLSGPLPAP
jgi:hypothetical protein